jgi:5'-3' exonuclease
VTSFRGKKLAIDASGWLHKSLWVTVEDQVDSNFAHDEQLYVDFFVTRVTNLRRSGTEPVFVFDGKRHAMKSETQAKRRDSRHAFMEQVMCLVLTSVVERNKPKTSAVLTPIPRYYTFPDTAPGLSFTYHTVVLTNLLLLLSPNLFTLV